MLPTAFFNILRDTCNPEKRDSVCTDFGAADNLLRFNAEPVSRANRAVSLI
jgi:hypothetical protein